MKSLIDILKDHISSKWKYESDDGKNSNNSFKSNKSNSKNS